MFKFILPVSAVILLTCPPGAGAVNLDRMSGQSKRIHCVAYGLIDVRMRRDSGQIDEAAFERERSQLIWKIQNRGDNFNYSSDFRKLNRAIETIVAEQPPIDEFKATAAACRTYLRL